MSLYQKILRNNEYLETVKNIENIKYGRYDWEHGLGHCKRVAKYAKNILTQLKADERTIDLGMTAALLHDVGLIKGDKTDHAIESGRIFVNFIKNTNITKKEEEILKQAITDHSEGYELKTLVGLALVLADKLDVTYHRTKNSSIQNKLNKEIKKIKKVDIEINYESLIVSYITENDFDVNALNGWKKPITIPQKVAEHLNIDYNFFVNGQQII